MNNNFNNPNNQGMQNGGVNNYNGQFGGNVPPQPQQPMMTQPTMQQPVNSPVNPQMTVPGNTNTQKSSKAPVIIIIVVILAIAAGGIVLALSGNNDDKKDSKPNNETNNSAEVNDSSNNNTNNQTNNNSDNTPNNNNSDDPAPLNSFANIGGNVEMKVNHTYVEDTYYFVTRVTFKNNGTTDVTLKSIGFDPEFVYFGAYFVPKSVGIANATEKDLISESCNLRKIVRSDGIETTITSGDTENTLFHFCNDFISKTAKSNFSDAKKVKTNRTKGTIEIQRKAKKRKIQHHPPGAPIKKNGEVATRKKKQNEPAIIPITIILNKNKKAG